MEKRWLGVQRVARQHVCKRVVKLWGPKYFIQLIAVTTGLQSRAYMQHHGVAATASCPHLPIKKDEMALLRSCYRTPCD
jgi:hypothetical protein